ncbi:hypothetical protein [Micromonospora peucetia]|uniref:Uncharacterized protein n=1 Tax=Micromonospora peucetia TaxID=47871 RepID=A0A1C6W572_9ACTN|nr:hypothetical protein [Micromonospora peucetia]SCL73641.1 hypothetical protein GA0070608_5951 [Micromonospora peucetia]
MRTLTYIAAAALAGGAPLLAIIPSDSSPAAIAGGAGANDIFLDLTFNRT